MVCPYDDEHLLLVLQVDHSKVTGWFAAHWGNDVFARPTPYASMVLAAQEHDNGGWWDVELTIRSGDVVSDRELPRIAILQVGNAIVPVVAFEVLQIRP